MKKLVFFLKTNAVMLIAALAALITAIIVPPDGEYLGYFDLRTLTCLFVVLAVVYGIISSIGIGTIIGSVSDIFDKPVNDKISRQEYIDSCEAVDAERFYRSPTQFKDTYVTLDLTVAGKITERGNKIYYVCHAQGNDNFEILVRDCLIDGSENLIVGDYITIYGEGDDKLTLYDEYYVEHTAPSVNMAYVVVWDVCD